MVCTCGYDPLPLPRTGFTDQMLNPSALRTHENFSVDIVWLSFERLGEQPQRAGLRPKSSLDISLYAGTENSCFLTYCHYTHLRIQAVQPRTLPVFICSWRAFSWVSDGLYYQPPLIVNLFYQEKLGK